ncbi:MAG: STAS domain-containing protein [Roseiflexaceae bacterium]
MREFFNRLLTIDSHEEDVRRRGRNVVIMALGLIVMGLLFVPVLLIQPIQAAILGLISVEVLVFAGLALLARSGRVTLSAWLLITIEILAVVGGSLISGMLSITPVFLIISVLIASLSLRPWQIWPVLAANLIGLIATILMLPSSPFAEPNGTVVVFGSILLLGIVALMGFLGAKSTSSALNIAQRSRSEAESAAQALSHANTMLEQTVAERTASLQTALLDVQARSDAQAHLLEEVQQQRILLRELSVPVIPISATTLVMPLVGALDSTRLQQIQEQALRALEHKSARYLVLDITGVPLVDSQVAQGLMTIVQAARLLGVQVLLVGIRPEVAQAIVGLGLDLRDIYTTSDLQSALSHIALN